MPDEVATDAADEALEATEEALLRTLETILGQSTLS
jgi:hypothetical protein